MNGHDLPRRLAAEALGTAFLLAVVVGSGIMGERLAGGNDAIALLGNTIATGAALVVLILIFGAISGAHFNPAVTLAFSIRREIGARDAVLYSAVQIAGGILGVIAAHFMFGEPLLVAGVEARTGPGQWLGEFVATFGLLATILGCLRARPEAIPYAVGLFITAGYWFTSSTSFANPAVTIARSFTDTFAGIAPADAPGFIAAQVVGALAATAVFGWLWSERRRPVAGRGPGHRRLTGRRARAGISRILRDEPRLGCDSRLRSRLRPDRDRRRPEPERTTPRPSDEAKRGLRTSA